MENEIWTILMRVSAIFVGVITCLLMLLWSSVNKRLSSLGENQKSFVNLEQCKLHSDHFSQLLEAKLGPLHEDIKSLVNGGHIGKIYGKINGLTERVGRIEAEQDHRGKVRT